MALAHTLGFTRASAGDHDFPEFTEVLTQLLTQEQCFQPIWTQLFDEVDQAHASGHTLTPVITGPLTHLWQGKAQEGSFDTLALLERLLPVYGETFAMLAEKGVEWVQIDEPVLCLDLPQEWKNAFERAYHTLQYSPLKKLISTHSAGLGGNLGLTSTLPVQGLHVNQVESSEQLAALLDRLPTYKVLSLGEVSGLDVSPCDAAHTQALLKDAELRFGENLWLSTSGSLLQSQFKGSGDARCLNPLNA